MGFPKATFRERSVLLDGGSTLLLADLHLGRVRDSDVELPLGEATDILDRLDSVLTASQPDEVLIAGDLIHTFGTVPYGVAETVRAVAETIRNSGASLVVTEGNHDSALTQVDSVEPRPWARVDEETVTLHGHEKPETEAERYVIGHDHPAITIEGAKHPCFLDCPDQYHGADVLVLPAYSRVAVGTTVNNRTATDTMSPLLEDLSTCQPIVPTAAEPLRFPPLSDLAAFL